MNAKPAPNPRLQPHAKSFFANLHELLTPALWKQAKNARGATKKSPKWSVQPLVLTLLAMTWCCGDSLAERFETAKGFTAVCLRKRRGPGKTVPGFQNALSALPVVVLRVLAAGVRRRLQALFNLYSEGFAVFGCDGSSMATPRVEELERRLDPPVKKNNGSPQVWVTALVHLRTGLLWSWRFGKGYNRERSHLLALLPTLPAAALVVADAGFNGYKLACSLTGAGVSFLIRMSGKDRLYTEKQVEIKDFEEGAVLLWTQDAQKEKLPPLRVRLLRIRVKKRRDVWLLTNVRARTRLTAEMAGRYYRWRWENEGLFRTFKRTLAKVKLMSRTVRLIHREAEGALLATQLLLAQRLAAMGQRPRQKAEVDRCSPRKVLLAIRNVINGKIDVRDPETFAKRMQEATREDRQRTSLKEKRKWPGRVKHKPQKPPRFLTLDEHEKALADKLLAAAA
jgi:Transposase DDE domain